MVSPASGRFGASTTTSDIAAADNGDTNLCHMLHAPLTFKMLNLHTRNSVQYYYIGYSI